MVLQRIKMPGSPLRQLCSHKTPISFSFSFHIAFLSDLGAAASDWTEPNKVLGFAFAVREQRSSVVGEHLLEIELQPCRLLENACCLTV
jgi:hypothetical protein